MHAAVLYVFLSEKAPELGGVRKKYLCSREHLKRYLRPFIGDFKTRFSLNSIFSLILHGSCHKLAIFCIFDSLRSQGLILRTRPWPWSHCRLALTAPSRGRNKKERKNFPEFGAN